MWLFLTYDLRMRVIHHLHKDTGLLAIIVLTIEAWGRYVLNVT